jgi:hypothetical protein
MVLIIYLTKFAFLSFIQVLTDWTSGNLRYYTHPPTNQDIDNANVIANDELLTQYAQEFSLDNLTDDYVKIVAGNYFCVFHLIFVL